MLNENPTLFATGAPERSFWAPGIGATAFHLAVIAAVLGVNLGPPPKQPEARNEVVLTFRIPKPKPKFVVPPPPLSPNVGGTGVQNGAPDVQPERRKLHSPIEALPLANPDPEPITPIEELEPYPDSVDVPDDPDDAFGQERGAVLGTASFIGHGSGPGAGLGVGTGFGTGVSAGNPPSKARKAWFATHAWTCERPRNEEEAGRVLVRIRVTISMDGRARNVVVVNPGPDIFNKRAIECATDAEYVSALDDDGNPFVSDAQFGVEFLPLPK